jgi:3',5'-cyclic AMP phosphodiesterase CpdA
MKVIQISDIHLAKDPKHRIYGLVNTQDTFIDVLNQVKAEKPDLVIVSGDTSQDGSAECILD